MSSAQRRVMRAIEICRTAALVGHVDKCDRCGHRTISHNSCRNRHCNKCQSLTKAKWLEKHHAQVLPVQYLHVVTIVPDQIVAIALQNKKVVYSMLFRATAETLRRIAGDPKHLGAQIGFLKADRGVSRHLPRLPPGAYGYGRNLSLNSLKTPTAPWDRFVLTISDCPRSLASIFSPRHSAARSLLTPRLFPLIPMAPASQILPTPHIIRPRKTNCIASTALANPLRVVSNHRSSCLGRNNRHSLLNGFVQQRLSEVSRIDCAQDTVSSCRETSERLLYHPRSRGDFVPGPRVRFASCSAYAPTIRA